MPDEYIKREDALQAVWKRIQQIGDSTNPYVLSIRQAVREVPAADVEPVIRCRDCENSSMCDPGGIRCTKILNNGKYMPVEGDFFCANGAKMDAEPLKEEKEGRNGGKNDRA